MALSHLAGVVFAAAALTGCSLTEVTASSRTYLGPSQSGAASNRSVRDTALEATRLFEVRGFALLEQRVEKPDGGLRLRFSRANRPLEVERTEVGSVFYVWVTPTATGSTISLLGKPTLAGIEPCTRDGVVLPCQRLSTSAAIAADRLDARVEADVARGVLAQLALDGYTVKPDHS